MYTPSIPQDTLSAPSMVLEPPWSVLVLLEWPRFPLKIYSAPHDIPNASGMDLVFPRASFRSVPVAAGGPQCPQVLLERPWYLLRVRWLRPG